MRRAPVCECVRACVCVHAHKCVLAVPGTYYAHCKPNLPAIVLIKAKFLGSAWTLDSTNYTKRLEREGAVFLSLADTCFELRPTSKGIRQVITG